MDRYSLAFSDVQIAYILDHARTNVTHECKLSLNEIQTITHRLENAPIPSECDLDIEFLYVTLQSVIDDIQANPCDITTIYGVCV